MCEDVDPLLMLLGTALYAQQLLLRREQADAAPVLRDVCAAAPSLLRATFDAWGYSPTYCLVEQLWLESYAGMVCASLGRAEPSRREGLAMAAQLSMMLQGKVQFRYMRHTVGDWALALAPAAARSLLLKGEVMLDQPLSGHDEAEAEPLLAAALEAHKRELAAAGVAAPGDGGSDDEGDGVVGDGDGDGVGVGAAVAAEATYWQVLARCIEEVGLGSRDAEAIDVLRDGIRWLPGDVDLYLSAGRLLEAREPSSAIELYAAFPPPERGAAHGFDHAVVASSSVRLLLDEGRLDSPWLLEHLVVIGKVLGVLNIEKYVQRLDAANAVETIKEAYMRILPDSIDQSAFFKLKGWDYSRTSASPARASI